MENKSWFDKIILWIAVSSANPDKASLTVKAWALTAGTFALKAIALSCGLGFFCVAGFDANVLASVVEILGNIVLWGFAIITAVIGLVGFIRKISITAAGENRAIQ